jgi:hypothetical protein
MRVFALIFAVLASFFAVLACSFALLGPFSGILEPFPFMTAPCDAGVHSCGEGPIQLIRIVEIPGCNPCKCTPSRRQDGTYEDDCVCRSSDCQTEVKETWTDWPECGGVRVLPR